MLGPSKCGRHIHSIEPSGATRAPVWQSDRNPYEAIGGKAEPRSATRSAAGRRRRVLPFAARASAMAPTLTHYLVLLCQPDCGRVEIDELALVGQQLAGGLQAVVGAERRGQVVEAVP